MGIKEKNYTIFITGGTGNFGKVLVKNLLKINAQLILLIRAVSQEQALSKVKNLFANDSKKIEKKISILKGDLKKENFGLSTRDVLHLKRNITHILHAAASTRFTLPLNKARENNVETTREMVNFASKCSRLKRFGFISTAFVAGKRTGRIMEEELEHREGFINTYQQSKYEAELLVKKYVKKLPITIFRPSLIIEQQSKPFIKFANKPINALNLGLFLARKGFLPVLPGRKKNRLDVISGKDAAKTIVRLFLKDQLQFLTYHITSAEKAPKLSELISLIENKTGQKINIRFCGDIETFVREVKGITRFRPDLALVYKKTESFLSELAFPKIFDHNNVLKELGSRPVKSNMLEEIEALLN